MAKTFWAGQFKSGASLQDSIRLFLYPADIVILSAPKDPVANSTNLSSRSVARDPHANSTIPPIANRQKLRATYPFLSSPTCPPELKILAADKITAYHEYCAAHAALTDCTTLEQQFQTVKQLVESFIENRKIFDEFNYYRQHGHALGLHPVFKQLDRIRELRSLSDIDLYKKHKALEHNVWRLQNQLTKMDNPKLVVQREANLKQKQAQLQEAERLLNGR